jgi:hypothetical protein
MAERALTPMRDVPDGRARRIETSIQRRAFGSIHSEPGDTRVMAFAVPLYRSQQ